ncbi:MAG: ArsR family transcriptional regulator [Acholeplasmatales bacterium]|nr:MAG: ArsR family transcriptional regulator [Acholeplasmatales bacterium]
MSMAKSSFASFKKNMDNMAQYFKVLCNPTRLNIIALLSEAEYNVSDISALTGIDQTVISNQLKELRYMNIVSAKRRGRKIFYSLNDPQTRELLEQCHALVKGK